MIRPMSLFAALCLAACTTPSQMLVQGQDAGVQTALRRGQFELNCPAATGTVLTSETIEPAVWRGIERAEYTVGVEGCGRRAVYIVVCPLGESNCMAVRQDRGTS
ncbi:hypothetical protein ACQW02_25680 [Humitalea sp. 24SJ18S-53]|uniref:hypothetical protein n=1 Tax=Humitalea sp. 24SJ18S-53 TaxID=3422307 RepID=UPI003D6742D7